MTERRLTVLQCLPALDGGGVEQGVLEIGQALVNAGHRSLVMSDGGRLTNSLVSCGSEHFRWSVGRKTLGVVTLIRPLARLLRDQQVDILHLRSRLPAWVGWLAWRQLPVDARPRLVTTVHGFYSVNRYSAIMTRGERVIAVSESIRRYIHENYSDVDADRVEVINRGIDPSRFYPEYQPSAKWQEQWQKAMPQLRGRRVVTLAARLTRLKGHHTFISMIRQLADAGDPVHGLIVGGEDPRRPAYAHELYDKAQGAPISFLGHRDDLRDIMSSSDAVVSVSTKPESFGRTVLEALALGTPVVGYAHGGVGEILDTIYPQGMVCPGDKTGLNERLCEALNTAPKIVTDHPFILAKMQSKTLALYHALAAKN
ncbi:MAG: glycosyltransferase [Chromatiales bacterium]|jgi:glycosyltransferase involved in cell wall biosynthesis|nr:glycosyltransferase [Chromatiales bacterium]